MIHKYTTVGFGFKVCAGSERRIQSAILYLYFRAEILPTWERGGGGICGIGFLRSSGKWIRFRMASILVLHSDGPNNQVVVTVQPNLKTVDR